MKKVANHTFEKCPRCQHKLVTAEAYTGPSEFWLECSNAECNTFVNTYIPQPHQYAFHVDDHRITANFGGLTYRPSLNPFNCWDTQTGQSAAKL